ncbi:MAG: ABC transporter ATP-binding protein [Bryobacteraceae bacterium]
MIECRGVSKVYDRTAGRRFVRTSLSAWLRRARPEPFHALDGVSFRLARGHSLAIVGANGAGKSTLLSLIAGISQPDAGSISVEGSVAALLELGSGFHPDLTGAENIRLNASLLGLSRARTAEMMDSIVEFSGLREFIDEPLRTYSTGMGARLAFAVAVHVDPDILLIDEVFAVGDHAFQLKCTDRIRSFKQAGKTLVCVSHQSPLLEELCEEALWLDRGRVARYGSASDVIREYEAALPRTGGDL